MSKITSEELNAIEALFNDWAKFNEEQGRIQDKAEGEEKRTANKYVIKSNGVLVGMQAVLNAIGYGVTDDGRIVSLSEEHE